MKKIVFFLPNGIGDALMSLPAIHRMISLTSRPSISVVVRNELIKGIVAHYTNKKVDVIVRFDNKPLPNLRLWLSLLMINNAVIFAPLLSSKLSHKIFFATLLSRVYVPSSFIKRSFFNFTRLNFCLQDYSGHQVNFFISFLRYGLPELNNSIVKFSEFSLSKNKRKHKIQNSVLKKPEIAVGISCSKNEIHKIPTADWFVNFLASLARKMKYSLLLIGDHEDMVKIKGLAAELSNDMEVEILVDISIPDLIDRLSYSDIGISGTTGQGHMMAAAGLPILVLSGVTSPYESGPYTSQVAVLKHNLLCGPCYQEKFRGGCGLIQCMDTLDIGDAVDLVVKLLKIPNYGVNWCDFQGSPPVSLNVISEFTSKFSQSIN